MSEAGFGIDSAGNKIDPSSRNWAEPMLSAGIRNRALVLISFSRSVESDGKLRLQKYQSTFKDPALQRCSDDTDAADEEDALLRHPGILFAREALLFDANSKSQRN